MERNGTIFLKTMGHTSDLKFIETSIITIKLQTQILDNILGTHKPSDALSKSIS